MNPPPPPLPSSPPLLPEPNSWQREYVLKTSNFFPIFFASVAGIIGLAFLFVKPWIGALALLGAVVIPLVVWYFQTSWRIVCGPAGFSVDSSSRRLGARHGDYRWSDVTATRFEEFHHTHSDNNPGTLRYFSADTAQGQAFRVKNTLRGFVDLIEVFNTMTVQLPYEWKPQAGFQITVGNVSAGRASYHQVPRNPAPPMLPPLPGAMAIASPAASLPVPPPPPVTVPRGTGWYLLMGCIGLFAFGVLGFIAFVALSMFGVFHALR